MILRYPPATRKNVEEFSISDIWVSRRTSNSGFNCSNTEISVEEIVLTLALLKKYDAFIFPVNKKDNLEISGTLSFNLAETSDFTDPSVCKLEDISVFRVSSPLSLSWSILRIVSLSKYIILLMVFLVINYYLY